MQKRVTIREVAEEVGVSVTTVSLVLNGKAANIPLCTKKRIEEVADKLNYRPDFTARSLVTGKTHTVGVIIPDITNTFFSEMVRHVQIELNKSGYDIILCNSEEQMANDVKYLRWLSARKVDGVLLTLSAESMEEQNRDKISSQLEALNVPYLFVDRYFKSDAPMVMIDNENGGKKVAELLVGAGHKNIGVITGPMSLNSSCNRLKGFCDQLAKNGISLPKENVVYGKYNMESGRQGAIRLLSAGVTAIFAFNDMQAYGAIGVLKENDVKIPEEVSVVGFDDDVFSTIVEPKLTTVKQPVMQMSHEICAMMMAMLGDEKHEKQVKLSTELVVRDSVKVIK